MQRKKTSAMSGGNASKITVQMVSCSKTSHDYKLSADRVTNAGGTMSNKRLVF